MNSHYLLKKIYSQLIIFPINVYSPRYLTTYLTSQFWQQGLPTKNECSTMFYELVQLKTPSTNNPTLEFIDYKIGV